MIELRPIHPRRLPKIARSAEPQCSTEAARLEAPKPIRPPGWRDHWALSEGDEGLCHPDSLTPRAIRHRARLVESLERAEAGRAPHMARSDLPPITLAEWGREWTAALEGRAINQGWAIPYTGGHNWLYDVKTRGRPHLWVLSRYGENTGRLVAQEWGGDILIVDPARKPAIQTITRDDPDRAERLAFYAWPKRLP